MNHSLKKMLAVVLISLFIFSPTSSANLPLPAPEATSSINVRDLKTHLSFLASDELGGRYTFSPSSRIAARYLATQLESFGYHGATRDGSFFQKVPLTYRSVNSSASAVTLTSGGAQHFKYADDFVGDPPVDMNFSGDLVFVGYGIASPRNNHDDYAGLDVKGKVVVIATGTPDALKSARLEASETAEQAAAARGAIGAIKTPASQYFFIWNQMKDYIASQQELGFAPKATASGKPFPSIVAGPNFVKALAKLMGKDASYLVSAVSQAYKPQALPASVDVKMVVEVKAAPPAQNVVGVLEGSDAKLKDEYLVLSAHYDHLQTTSAGEVFNGADDDGSGTAAVLEIAQAFATGERPRRSILVIFHTGEELGLYGSEYNADYEPVVSLAKLVANLNIDMIGRSRAPDNKDNRDKMLTDKNSIYIIGSDKLSTELHRLSEQTNADTARLRFDYTYNDENHPERFYYRSDHYNYAKHGVPIIFYFTGVHRDYHKTTDDVEKIDFEKMERIARMIFATGWRIANLNDRLTVDKKPAPAR
jgi:hypothetical protein